LGASVLEEFLALGGSNELHVFQLRFGRTPAVRSPNRRTAQGPPGVERSSSMPNQRVPRKAASVIAALRWRGRCVLQGEQIVRVYSSNDELSALRLVTKWDTS